MIDRDKVRDKIAFILRNLDVLRISCPVAAIP